MKIGLIDVDKQSRTVRNEVYNCDCIEYMRTLPDHYFDIAVCDPPYVSANSEEYIGGGEIWRKIPPILSQRKTGLSASGAKGIIGITPPKIGADSREGGENDITNQPLPRRYLGNTIQTLFGGGRRN